MTWLKSAVTSRVRLLVISSWPSTVPQAFFTETLSLVLVTLTKGALTIGIVQ